MVSLLYVHCRSALLVNGSLVWIRFLGVRSCDPICDDQSNRFCHFSMQQSSFFLLFFWFLLPKCCRCVLNLDRNDNLPSDLNSKNPHTQNQSQLTQTKQAKEGEEDQFFIGRQGRDDCDLWFLFHMRRTAGAQHQRRRKHREKNLRASERTPITMKTTVTRSDHKLNSRSIYPRSTWSSLFFLFFRWFRSATTNGRTDVRTSHSNLEQTERR